MAVWKRYFDVTLDPSSVSTREVLGSSSILQKYADCRIAVMYKPRIVLPNNPKNNRQQRAYRPSLRSNTISPITTIIRTDISSISTQGRTESPPESMRPTLLSLKLLNDIALVCSTLPALDVVLCQHPLERHIVLYYLIYFLIQVSRTSKGDKLVRPIVLFRLQKTSFENLRAYELLEF